MNPQRKPDFTLDVWVTEHVLYMAPRHNLGGMHVYSIAIAAVATAGTPARRWSGSCRPRRRTCGRPGRAPRCDRAFPAPPRTPVLRVGVGLPATRTPALPRRRLSCGTNVRPVRRIGKVMDALFQRVDAIRPAHGVTCLCGNEWWTDSLLRPMCCLRCRRQVRPRRAGGRVFPREQGQPGTRSN